MRMFIVKALSTAALFAMAGSASAQIVFLSPDNIEVLPGEEFQVDVMTDFQGNQTVGGALDFFWDPSVITLIGFEFGPDSGDPLFNVIPDDSVPGELFELGFGNFPALADTGTVAILFFRALATEGAGGMTEITVAETTGPFGGFPEFDPEFFGASVTVVPVPAAIWMMFGGLGALVGFARRRVFA